MTIGLAITTSGASAQTTVNVPVTLTSDSAITVANTQAMDFGTWVLIDGSTDSTLVLNPVTGTVTSTAGTAATIAEITPSATVGTVTCSTPASATINHWGTVTVDFADAGLALGTLTYSLNDGATAALPTVTGTTITTTGGVDTLEYGGTTTVSATPANAAHTATVQIRFAY
jgi:hypothetical protein